jgi:hypothetical protein
MKPMINVGQKPTAQAKQIELLLEKGYDIYVLRLRKLTEYIQTIHGFDDISVKQYKSPNSNEVSYRLEPRPSSYASFEPNEEGVATAYVAGTRRNIDVIASHLYSNQFSLMEIMTPSGIIPQGQSIKKIVKRAQELGIFPPEGDTRYAAYESKNPPPAPAKEEIIIQGDAGKNLPSTELPKTPKEARLMAENQVHTKYATLVDFLKKKSPEKWKITGEYKSVIKPEIEMVEGELIKLAGFKPREVATPEPEEEEALVK